MTRCNSRISKRRSPCRGRSWIAANLRAVWSGSDLGIKRDHSAAVVLLCDFQSHRIKVAHVKSWAPVPGGQVNLDDVYQHLFVGAGSSILPRC